MPGEEALAPGLARASAVASVGLIVNPNASRDVRRLGSLARTVDIHERANAVARALCGLAGGGVETVWYTREPAHVVERAQEALAATPAAITGMGVRRRTGPARAARRAPAELDVLLDDAAPTIALVDVAVVHGGWIGAHAIWEPDLLVEAVLVRSDPSLTGLAGVAGVVRPLEGLEPEAIHLRFGRPGQRILAPLGPGQLVSLDVHDWRLLRSGDRVFVPGPDDAPSGQVTLAFDGEREVVVDPGAVAEVRLVADGPRVLDAAALLRAAAAEGRLTAPRGPAWSGAAG